MSLTWLPLGDRALLAYCVDEQAAWRWAQAIRECQLPGVVDVVQAYASVAVFFGDEVEVPTASAVGLGRITPGVLDTASKLFVIPCCYEMGLDLDRVAEEKRLTVERVIELHSSSEYTVYAIGFCPGFPYLGYLPPELEGVPRLPSPRVKVEAGSVGLTGRQTRIYTEVRPGGWNIVGRTPLELVNVADGYFPLRTGDRVRFERIDRETYERLRGKRL